MGIEIITLERKNNFQCTSSDGECLGERAFGKPLTEDLRSSVKLLQAMGLYTFSCQDSDRIDSTQYQSCQSVLFKRRRLVTEFGLLIAAAGYMALNVVLLCYNVYAMHYYSSYFGMWDPETVMIIISGMKPVQSLINIGTMTYRRQRHRQLFRQMSELDHLFRTHFCTTVNGHRINWAMLGGAVCVVVCCCLLRLVQYVVRGETFGANWYSDISFLIIVLLGLWQFLPIWHTIEFLVETYFKIASLIKTLDRVFNVFVLLSIARCIFALCLTICFLTEAGKVVNLPDNLRSHVRLNVYFNVVWSSLEILLAFMYIFIISYGGMRTNEEARFIIGSILNCEAKTDEERFLIYILTQKVNTQHSWGISAWRAFPIERTFGFTIASGILTYFFLIRKLKDTSAANCEDPIFGEALNISNVINDNM